MTVSTRRRIGFVVDHPKRDLPSGTMLAHALAEKGMETALIPFYDQGVDVPLLELSAVIVNYARPVNLDLVRQYAEAGIPVYVIDTEGGVLAKDGPNTPHVLARYVNESGYRDLLAGYFFWGAVLKDAFAAESGLPEDRLHLTGCPRFDYASPRYRDLLEFDRSGYFLVNTNFPAVNPRFLPSGTDDRHALRDVGLSDTYIDRMLSETRLILDGMINTVHHLAVRFPEERFLVRPHPFESQEFYQTKFEGLRNVSVDGQGGVLNVLKHAKGLLHVNCGTAIEAVMLGVLPMHLGFLDQPFMAEHALLPAQASRQVSSMEELEGLIENVAKATEIFPFEVKHRETVQPFFYLNDGLAAERMAAVLHADLTRTSRPSPHSLQRSLASSRQSPSIYQRIQGFAANILGSRLASQLRARLQSRRRDKYVAKEQVAKAMDKLSNSPVRVEHARHPITGTRLITLIVAP